MATKTVRICPVCGSTQVASIEQKVKELDLAMRDSASNLMFGFKILQELANRFNIQKHRLFELRNSGMQLTPSLESCLLQIYQIIPRIQQQVIEDVQRILENFRYSISHLSNLFNPEPRDLKSLEQGIDTLERDIDLHRKQLIDLLGFPQQTLKDVDQMITDLNKHLGGYLPLQQLYPLKSNEHLVATVPSIKIQDTPDPGKPTRVSGTLIITDRRIALITLRGLFRKHYEVVLDQALERDCLVEEHGAIRKAIHIRTPKGVLKIQVPKDLQSKISQFFDIATSFDGNHLTDLNLTREVSLLSISLVNFRERLRDSIDRVLHRNKHPGSTYRYTSYPSYQPRYNQSLNTPITPPTTYNTPVFETPPPTPRYQVSPFDTQYPFYQPGDPLVNPISQPPQTPTTYVNPSPFLERSEPANSHFDTPSLHSLFSNNPTSPPPSLDSQDVDLDYNTLMGEYFALQQSIKWIQKQYNDGRINSVEYLNQFQNLEKKRYIIEQKLKKFQSRTYQSSSPFTGYNPPQTQDPFSF
jgi:hypothetical protein